MNNADMPAMPQSNDEIVTAFLEHEHDAPNGLSKRERIAIAAMQGFCSSPAFDDVGVEVLAESAVLQADALLAELESTGGES